MPSENSRHGPEAPRTSLAGRIFRLREHELILAALCLVAVVFSFLNPLWYGHAPEAGGSAYALFGRMWAHGEVLYRDMIDVKGPGIYFINMAGYRIGGFPGIALVEALFMVLGVISVDLALRLFRFSPLSRFCSIVTVISLLGLRYYQGNMVEEYGVYLAMIASYPLALLFFMRRFSWAAGIVPGLCFAFTTSIHFTNGPYFVAWFLMLFLYYLASGRALDALRLALCAAVSFLAVFGAFFLYFYSIGDMSLVSDAAFYSFSIHFSNLIYNQATLDFAKGITGFVRTGLWIVLAGFLCLIFRSNNRHFLHTGGSDRKWFIMYLLTGVAVTAAACSLTGHAYDHCDSQYMPFMFIPLAFLMHRYLHVSQDIRISFLTVMFLLAFLVAEHMIWPWDHSEWPLARVYRHAAIDSAVAFGFCLIIYLLRMFTGFYRHSHTIFLFLSVFIAFIVSFYALITGFAKGTPPDADTAERVRIIRENTGPGDKIWVEGAMYQYYVWTDRNTASPYLMTPELAAPYDFKTKVLSSLTFFLPKFIVVSEPTLNRFREAEREGSTEGIPNQDQAFMRFVRTDYTEVMEGLFRYAGGRDEDLGEEVPEENGALPEGAAGEAPAAETPVSEAPAPGEERPGVTLPPEGAREAAPGPSPLEPPRPVGPPPAANGQ